VGGVIAPIMTSHTAPNNATLSNHTHPRSAAQGHTATVHAHRTGPCGERSVESPSDEVKPSGRRRTGRPPSCRPARFLARMRPLRPRDRTHRFPDLAPIHVPTLHDVTGGGVPILSTRQGRAFCSCTPPANDPQARTSWPRPWSSHPACDGLILPPAAVRIRGPPAIQPRGPSGALNAGGGLLRPCV
jgi:hypothetical protein